MSLKEKVDNGAQASAAVAALTPRRRRLLLGLALLGMLCWLGFGAALDPKALWAALVGLGPRGIAGLVMLSLLNYLLRFARWHWFLGQLGYSLRLRRHLLIYFAGFSLTVSPGKAGEALRSLYLRPLGVGYGASLAALFAERLLDLLAIAVLATMVVAGHPAYRPLVAGVLAAALALAALIGLPRWHFALLRLAAVSPRWLRGLAVGLAQALRVSRRLLRPRLLVPGVLIGLLAWSTQGYVLYVITHQFGIALDPGAAVSVYALAILASVAVFFVPNGLGGTEAAMAALLVGFGAPLKQAIMATLLCQLSTLWLAVLLGMAAAAVLESAGAGSSPGAVVRESP
jgi:glycosyltransferase 2 family protein